MTIVDIHNITVLETQAVAMLGSNRSEYRLPVSTLVIQAKTLPLNAQSGSAGVCLMTLSHIAAQSFHLSMPPEELSP